MVPAFEPDAEESVQVTVPRRHGRESIRLGAGVQAFTQVVLEALAMIAERHEGVAPVASDEDVARVGEERDAVGRRVALDEATVGLRIEPRKQLVAGIELGLEPRRQRHDGGGSIAIGPQEARDDRLRPGGAALGRRTDEDVARPVDEAFPAPVVVHGGPIRA